MAQQTVFPADDWTRAVQPDGTVYEVRQEFLTVGYTGGAIMERDEARILFAGLPAELTRATLVVHPTEYANPVYAAYVRAGGRTLFTDDQETPTPIQVDMTALVRVSAGTLAVSMEPERPPGTVNFIRRYGSVRGPERYRPRLLLEGVPGERPPGVGRWVLFPVFGGIAAGMGGLAWLGRRGR